MQLNEGYGQPRAGGQRELKPSRQPNVTVLSQSAAPASRGRNPGIMGGLSVGDSRDQPAHRVSLLDNQPRKSCSLTTPRVVTALYTAFVIVVLLVMHLHMVFAIRDWKMQQRALQLRRHELEMQSETVARLTNQYLDTERLHFHAERLGMQPLENASTLIVSEAAHQKYQPRSPEKAEKSVNLALDENNAHRNLSLLTEMVWPRSE